MPDFMTEVALALLFPVLGMYVLYWVIRLAVRHGLRDVQNEDRLLRSTEATSVPLTQRQIL